jgi:hypothetical protein
MTAADHIGLRNTGELDLDNTSERIGFLESPSPVMKIN